MTFSVHSVSPGPSVVFKRTNAPVYSLRKARNAS